MQRPQIPGMPDLQDNTSGERIGEVQMRYTKVSYTKLAANLPPPDPRINALLRLIVDTHIRQHSAMILGAPITKERAREEVIAALSDKDRALIARDVTEGE